jgi:hypothetical protein
MLLYFPANLETRMSFMKSNMRNLSSLLALCVVSSALFLSCGKAEKMEIPDNWSTIQDACSDGIMNNNEEEVDCGGDCGPCGDLDVPCNPAMGYVIFDGVSYEVESTFMNSDNFSINTYSGLHVSIETGIYIDGGLIFPLTPAVNPIGQLAHIEIDDGFDIYRSQTGTGALYIEGSNDNRVFTVCDGVMKITTGSTTKSLEFKVN